MKNPNVCFVWNFLLSNSQESVINKERSGRSVVLTAARSFFIDSTFLTMSKLLDQNVRC